MHFEAEEEYMIDDGVSIDTSQLYQIRCTFCLGTGVHPATMKSLSHSACPTCRGIGIVKLESSLNHYKHCPLCEGNGRESNSEMPSPCRSCGGGGIILSSLSDAG
jgi:DnaJ-class molecular chaperone